MFALWLLLLAQTTAPPCQVAVLDVDAGAGVLAENAATLTDVVTGEVAEGMTGCSVLARSELRALLNFETERQLAGCTDESCLAELGDALGVDRLVMGSLSKLEGHTVLALRLVDLKRARVERRVTDSSTEADLVPFAAWMARRLVRGDEAAGPRPEGAGAKTQPPPRMTAARQAAWASTATGAGMMFVAGGLGLATWGISETVTSIKVRRGTDVRDVRDLENAGPWLAGGSNLALYLGAAALVVGAGLFFLPAEEAAMAPR